MVAGDPTRKGTAASQHVDVTNEDAQGGIYDWTTSGYAGIWRYDVGTPDVPPSPYFADDARPAGCMGARRSSRSTARRRRRYTGTSFPQTFGASDEPLFYLTFSSKRQFGSGSRSSDARRSG